MNQNPPEVESAKEPIAALLADDEELARVHLRRLVEAQGVRIVGETENAQTTLEQIEALKPEVVFLDIQMPGLTGLQMASALPQLSHTPLLVFVTGYSRYAADAFDKDAVEYLLKPVSAERLARALARVRRRLALLSRPLAENPSPPGSDEETGDATPTAAAPLSRIPVRADYAVRFIRIKEAVRFEARDRAVYVWTPEGEAGRTHHNLSQLEALLPGENFLRVHDSHLVNLDYVEELCFLGNHAYALRLSTGQVVPVGKTRYADVRRCLHLTPPSPRMRP